MKKIFLLSAFFLFKVGDLASQTNQPGFCGQKEVTEILLKKDPALKKKFTEVESSLRNTILKTDINGRRQMRQKEVVVLPVVVHIIHNGGSENITDAMVIRGIQLLNDGFAARNEYGSEKGIDTRIQFCLAERTPDGKPTTGITRDISSHTTMGGAEYYSDDELIKSIHRWDPNCYINIWVVKSIPGNVVGYANLPAAAGTPADGIVMEAAYLGSSAPNNVVLTHEMGHYLGLYHTFEGGCVNNDCLTDGDKVCDTPPDQSTASVSCNTPVNSCTTDILSGFNTDQNDLKEDYMDYGNFDCMNLFTAGQTERMRWFIDNVRFTLMNCKSCLPPCPNPVHASFMSSAKVATVGSLLSFTNQSVNAGSYKWFVDGILQSTAFSFNFQFDIQGLHIIKVIATNNDNLCGESEFSDTIQITCPVKAGITPPAGIAISGQSVFFENTSSNAVSYIWKINGGQVSNAADLTHVFPAPGIFTLKLIASNNQCNDSVSIRVSVYDANGIIPPDLCVQPSFQKIYQKNNLYIYDLSPTQDSGYIIAGGYNIPGVDINGGSFAGKMDKNGVLQWSKYIIPSRSAIMKMKETHDGNFIGTGYYWESVNSTTINKVLLVKLNKDGDVIWAKKFGIPGSSGEKGLDVTETKDGGYAFCGSENDDGWAKTNWMAGKTDASGNLLWAKTFDNGFYERAYGIIANNDTLVVTGIQTRPTGPRSEIVVTKLNAKDRTIIQSKSFAVANRSVETTSIFKIPGGYMVGAHSVADGFYYADMDIVVLQLDENLSPLRSARINADIFASVHGGFHPTPDGGFVAVQDGPNWSVTKDATFVTMYKVNAQWQMEWSKKFTLPLAEGQDDFIINGVHPSNSGFVTGSTITMDNTTHENFRIIKTNDLGDTPGCNVTDFRTSVSSPNVIASDFKWSSSNDVVFDNPINIDMHVSPSRNVDIKEVQQCLTSDCNLLVLQGRDSICNLTDTVTYTTKRNPECSASVIWGVETSLATIVSQTDSSVSLIFKKSGKLSLSSMITTSCRVLRDSMSIYIANNNRGIHLGSDIELCENSIIQLNAGVGFRNYKWSDGSSDSTLTAYNPGIYFVSATDYCGNLYSDTIRISRAPDFSLNLDPVVPNCDNDTLTLTLPAGFEKYIWSPQYNVSNDSSNIVKLWPQKDTTYSVTVQRGPGCIAVDTIRVYVLHAQYLNLGSDTSFCAGGEKVLTAPPGFTKYTWQDGSNGATLIAKQKGIYWLHALNSDGCTSRDTMEIAAVYPLPSVNLGKDGKICRGEESILNAGAGYLSYLWQDGSTLPTYAAKEPGEYSVSVTNENHCTSTDSIQITGFYPQPGNFLNKSVSICENAKENISAIGRWSSYLWSNGSHESFANISSPGEYWLEVTNDFGCSGRDTVTVSLKADCPLVINFPNAFTPNNDGMNDIFKPTVMAPLEKYHLVIFNRWGQKVFESYDVSQGWDGRMVGDVAKSDVYVWWCSYHFFGQPGEQKKGTVVLVR